MVNDNVLAGQLTRLREILTPEWFYGKRVVQPGIGLRGGDPFLAFTVIFSRADTARLYILSLQISVNDEERKKGGRHLVWTSNLR